jgi:hypothetical protein
VLTYAQDFIPAWAGAISIDLLPGVLVFILAVVHGAIRRQEERLPFADRITAGELLRALEVQRALAANGIDIEKAVADAEKKDAAAEDRRPEDVREDEARAEDMKAESGTAADEPNNITNLEARSRGRDRLHEDR